MLIGLGLESGLVLVMHYSTPKAKVLGKPFQFFCLTTLTYVYFWNLVLCIATFSFNIVLHLAWPSVSTGLDWGKSLKRYVVSCQRHFLLATLTILTLFSHFSQ